MMRFFLLLSITVQAQAQEPSAYQDQMPTAVAKAVPAVGALLVRKFDRSKKMIEKGGCTSFLISSQILMTNSHCFLPYNSGEEEYLEVKVMLKSPGGKWQTIGVSSKPLLDDPDADIAVVRLDEPVDIRDVIPLPIAVRKKLPKHPWRISVYFDMRYFENPRPGYAPRVTTEPCSRYPDPDNEGTFVGCTSRPGNSGSPMVNNAGEVVSILKAIRPETPKRYIPGTEFIVGKVTRVFSTSMKQFARLYQNKKSSLERYVLMQGRYPWDAIRMDGINYKSVGHLKAIWP